MCNGAPRFVEIDGVRYAVRLPTDHAYLLDVQRYMRWHERRYGVIALEEALGTAALNRYWQWCRTHLSPATVTRRQIALRWFVVVGVNRAVQDP